VKPADHLTDERLLARYFDPSVADGEAEIHLFRCPACASRRDELAAALDADHDRTVATADAYFCGARLERQRASILERVAHPREAQARVLAFPGVAVSAATPSLVRALGTHSRWTAAAAVLLISVSAGGGLLWNGPRHVARVSDGLQTAPVFAQSLVHDQEDAVLSEIDLALARPQTAELLALDALTPRAGEQPINP
jgi:hypothetical protein